VVSERLADGRVKVNLRDQVAFDLNSVELRGGSRSFLDRVAAALVARPNVLAQVVGYTDPTGSPERNLALSRRRAEAVSTYLASRGVAGSRLLVEGRGSQPDPSTNVPSTEIWRLRRIELYLTEAPDQPAP
jgi:outer membrane protein OmpA-like peptidoglycan-associated protein